MLLPSKRTARKKTSNTTYIALILFICRSTVEVSTSTRRKLVSTNRRGTVVRPSWECRRSVMGGFLVTLPRRFCGRFLTTKRQFVETVVTLSWCGSVVDASWMASWHRRGRPAGRIATMVSRTVFDNKMTVLGNRRGTIMAWKCR